MHMHHERLVSVSEEAPEFARPVPSQEWGIERGRDRIAQMLTESAGYHHGQIKLALKLGGQPISDDQPGPFTWDVWRHKRQRS